MGIWSLVTTARAINIAWGCGIFVAAFARIPQFSERYRLRRTASGPNALWVMLARRPSRAELGSGGILRTCHKTSVGLAPRAVTTPVAQALVAWTRRHKAGGYRFWAPKLQRRR